MAFSSMVKDINRKIILESFWDFSRNTKQDITKKTELSFPTVSKLVDELNEQDIIHMLSDKRGETGGRKANEYILNQEYAYSLCLKVEREYIEVFIVDLYKQNISYDKIEEKSISAEKILKVIETSVYKGYKQDKIEMRGDRAEMSDFPLYLNTVAGGLDRRDQTIGGFSFVVKIYAVPVVEIIG